MSTGPLRIALLTYSTKPRGGVVHTLSLAESLAAAGHAVTVWSLARGGDAGFFRPVDPSVRVRLVPFPDRADEGVGPRILRSIRVLRAAFDPGDADIVHAQDCITANAVGRCVRTVHHLDHFTTPELAACHERAIIEPYAHVCVSRAVATELRAGWGISATVIANGVDAARFAAAAEPGGQAQAARAAWRARLGPYVLATGGIEPRKGTLDLVEAMAVVRESVPDLRLVLAGGETLFDYRDYRSAVLERAGALGVDLAVLGTVPHGELPALTAAADAFAFPSTAEGFGLAPMEALAAGVPVVVRDLPVLREVFGGAARTAADVPSLARSLLRACREPDPGRRERGRALALRHTWAAAAAAHVAFYRSVDHRTRAAALPGPSAATRLGGPQRVSAVGPGPGTASGGQPMTTTETTTVAHEGTVGELEVVHLFEGPMPTGVTVSHDGRIFVCYPKWGDDVTFTVGEIRDGQVAAYPDQRTNDTDEDDLPAAFVSVQSVVVDPANRLWALDTGSPMFRPTSFGGPKLVCIDLATDEVLRTITFPTDVALPTTYLNDVRFDLRRGTAGTAFITDSADQGPNGIIVVDLESGESWRRLHEHPSTKAQQAPDLRMVVEGEEFVERSEDGSTSPVTMGADGIAIGADGSRLYYCPLATRRWYSVSVDALVDRDRDDDAVAATVRDEGDKGSVSDGLETDEQGRLYVTAGESNAIFRRDPDGSWGTLVHDDRLLWPDTMSVAADGHLYVTANQLYRQSKYRAGKDERRQPYALFRVAIGAGPVRLGR